MPNADTVSVEDAPNVQVKIREHIETVEIVIVSKNEWSAIGLMDGYLAATRLDNSNESHPGSHVFVDFVRNLRHSIRW